MQFLLAFGTGIILGLFYFGGLWWTVKKLNNVRWPAALMLLSFIARTGIVLSGFYLIMDGQLRGILVSFAGFIMVRFLLKYSMDWYDTKGVGER